MPVFLLDGQSHSFAISQPWFLICHNRICNLKGALQNCLRIHLLELLHLSRPPFDHSEWHLFRHFRRLKQQCHASKQVPCKAAALQFFTVGADLDQLFR